MDLPVIIQSAVEASIASAMQSFAAINTAAVEPRSIANNLRHNLSLIMRAHFHHICGVPGDDDKIIIYLL